MCDLLSVMQELWSRDACRLANVIAAATFAIIAPATHAEDKPPVMDGTYVYAAVPGVGDDVEKGGDGIVVFDADHQFKFVKRISLTPRPGRPPESARGIVASLATRMLYVAQTNRLVALDLETDKLLWVQAYDGKCCDRPDISPDISPEHQILYVPALGRPAWYVVSALSGRLITVLPAPTRGHNTVFSSRGDRVYLSPVSASLLVADARRAQIIGEIGPFSARVRPFVINGTETLVFASVTGLLGVGVGDLTTGKVLAEVRAPSQFPCFTNIAHATCTHGIALTPDEREIWIADANHFVHVFDAKSMPPKYEMSIAARTSVGWLSCSIDGTRMYPSSGDVIDVASKRIIAGLSDEKGGALESEKLLEIRFAKGKISAVGDQWCNGRNGRALN